MSNQSKSPKARIGVCGFQEKGFEIPTGHVLMVGNFELTFMDIENTKYPLNGFDGTIVASGAFEKIERKNNYIHGTVYSVEFNHPALLKREREAHNLIDKGGWICGFVDDIIDEVTDSSYRTQDLSELDLVKKVMNNLGIRRSLLTSGASIIECKSDEFKAYFKNHAAAHTSFDYYSREFKRLAVVDGKSVALACNNNVFLLPFHFATGSGGDELLSALEAAITGILNYRAKNEVTLPSWLDEIEFAEEQDLASEIETFGAKLVELNQRAFALKVRKSILTTSGEILVEQINSLLREFFGLSTEAVEKRIEDLKILDRETSKLMVAVEVKGVTSGVKREHVSQVDSHRERIGVSDEVPGLLLINDNAKIEGVLDRWRIEVDKDHIKHAVKLNVTILRTVDLLLLMKSVETHPIDIRGKFLLDQFQKGGGWLRFVDGILVHTIN